MAAYKFVITIAFLLADLAVAVPSSSTSNHGVTFVGKMLIDTDTGGDDSVAILAALEAERLDNGPKIVGITCVHGNAEVNDVAMNVLKTLKVVDRLDIPVFLGASHPLLVVNKKDYFFGRDGFGDFDYPDPPSLNLIQKQHAVNAMIEMVKASPGEITLVALGPLTNVALAIRMYPRFLDELQQLIIMGGSVEGRGNSRPNIEFNFFHDSAANFIVFSSSKSKPAILVPYDTTERNRLPMEFRMSLSQSNNSKVWLINSTERRSISRRPESWGCPDLITTAVAITSSAIVTESGIYYLNAIYEGAHTSGMVLVDYRNVTRNPPNVNIVQGIDKAALQQLVSKYFSD